MTTFTPAQNVEDEKQISSPQETIRPTQTKIIATVGPATSDIETLRRLILAGVSIFRLNFSHGDLEQQAASIDAIREISMQLDLPIAIMGDLQGPKIRIGKVHCDGVNVKTGSTVIIQRATCMATDNGEIYRFCCSYEGLIDDVEPGQRLLVNDGAVRMLIVEKHKDEIECSVTYGGLITTGKGINLPDTCLRINALTERDWCHAEFAVRKKIDCLAMSFVRSAEDITGLRKGLQRICVDQGCEELVMPIVAKIELPEAVRNIEEIVMASDAVMIARGDLGVEMDLARVPVIQKELLEVVHDHGKPCIVATQMLESMIDAPIPTRAEASDVAGAVFDEADAVMLSGETAVGRYPVIAVETMRRIAEQTESHIASQPPHEAPPNKLVVQHRRMAALAHGVWTVSQDINASFIAVWTTHGRGARYLSQNSFRAPIIAATSDVRVARQIQFFRNVIPLLIPEPQGLAELARNIDDFLLSKGWGKPGDRGLLVTGGPLGGEPLPYRLSIHSIAEL